MRNADVIDQQRCILHQKVNIYISNAIDSNVSGIHGVNKTVYLIFQPEAGIGKKGSKILLHLIKESSSGGAPFHTGKIRLTILGINKQCFTALDNCSFQNLRLLSGNGKYFGKTYCLIESGFNTFSSGYNKNKVHPQFTGNRSTDHITQNHFIALLLQMLHLLVRLRIFIQNNNLNIILKKIAQHFRTICNGRIADNGKTVGIIFRKLDGTENIIYGNLNFDYRDSNIGRNHLRSTATGNDNIEIVQIIGLYNFKACSQISDSSSHFDIITARSDIVNYFFHALIRSYC